MVILKADNRIILDSSRSSFLSLNYVSGTDTFTIASTEGFATDQVVLMGEFGSESSEILRVESAANNIVVTTASSRFAHPESTKISIIPFNQVVFYHTTTDTFSATTVLATVDIQADDIYTKYTDNTYTTGFGWFRFYNSISALSTDESNAIPYADFAENSAKKLIDSFFSALNNKEKNLINDNDAYRYLNEGLSRLQNHLNLVNTEYNVEQSTITTTSGTSEYDLDDHFSDLITINAPGGLQVPHIDIWDVPFYESNPHNLTRYYLRNKKIGFTPQPTSAVAYTLWWKNVSAAIESLYSTLDFPNNNYYPILDFMLYRACPKLGRSQSEAAGFLSAFNDGANLMKVTSIKQNSNNESFTIGSNFNV